MSVADVAFATVLVMATLDFSVSHAESGNIATGIDGVITIAPFRGGPISQDTPNIGPLSNATFTVQDQNGVVASFTTDSNGHFQVCLAPGHYQVSRKGDQPKIGRFGPFDVDVVPGKVTKVEWQCDSGMR